MDDDVAPLEAELAFPTALPRKGDRRVPDAVDPEPHLDLVVEAEWLVEVADYVTAWVSPWIDDSEVAHKCRLGRLRPAKGDNRLKLAVRIDIRASTTHSLDVLCPARRVRQLRKDYRDYRHAHVCREECGACTAAAWVPEPLDGRSARTSLHCPTRRQCPGANSRNTVINWEALNVGDLQR
jgi:hypothetical protein